MIERYRRITKAALIATAGLALAGCASDGNGGLPAGAPGEAPPTGETRSAGFVRDLAAGELDGFLAAHPRAFVLDVRLPAEWDDDLGHLEDAVLIPVQELPERLGELPPERDTAIVVYCRSGMRSTRAAAILAQEGYRGVYHLMGGLQAYRALGR